jgi:dCMP deaminase
MRQDWDTYFMTIAKTVATRSTCLRRQVGAVIVRDRAILSTGYNGAPKGVQHCTDIGCMRKECNVPSGEREELCRAVHAEQNAIAQAARHGSNINKAWIYCTLFPCITCAKLLINAGIKTICYQEDYGDIKGRAAVKDYLQQANVGTIIIPGDVPVTNIPVVLESPADKVEFSIQDIVKELTDRGIRTGKGGSRVNNTLHAFKDKFPNPEVRQKKTAAGFKSYRVYPQEVIGMLEKALKDKT